MTMVSDNEVLDRLIRTRRTVRSFTAEVPARELIEQMIEAGRQAPYASLAVAGTTDFRHFIVIPKSSPKIELLKSLVTENLKKKLVRYETEMPGNPKVQAMLSAYRMQLEKGLRGVGVAPWFMLVAERRGYPEREEQSLAHAMQNMWLKAHALGLAFQLVSSIGDLGDNQQLNDIAGLPGGEFAYEACSIGYAADPVSKEVRAIPHLSIKWLD